MGQGAARCHTCDSPHAACRCGAPRAAEDAGKWSAHLRGMEGASAIREEGEVEVGRRLVPTCPRNLRVQATGPFHEEMSVH